eukprot:s643_g2.t3
MRADSPAGACSPSLEPGGAFQRPPRPKTSLSDSAATGRFSPETPRSARSGAFSRPQRPKSRGSRPASAKRFKVDPDVGFDWCKGPHYARFPQEPAVQGDQAPKKEAWSFVCRMRGLKKPPDAPEAPPASVTQIFQRHWQQIRQSKRPEIDQAPKCRLEKGVVGKVSSPSFRAKPTTATAKPRNLRESGPSELTIGTDSATQESSPEAPASPSTPGRSPTSVQHTLSRQGTREKLHLSQVEAGLEKIATERLPRVRTFQFAADKEDEDVEEAATLSRDTAAFRELKAQVVAARTGTDMTEASVASVGRAISLGRARPFISQRRDDPGTLESRKRCGSRSAWNSDTSQGEVPKNVAEMVSGLKSSTENSLNQGCSRLDIELPPSFRKLGGSPGIGTAGTCKDLVLKEVARGDRELARLFVEMLEAIGPGLVVAFRTSSLEKAAKKRWKLDKVNEAQVISFFDSKKSAFASEVEAPAQFNQKLKKLDCKCLLVVAPHLDQLRFVAQLSKEVQDQMGIILLNSRIFGNRKEFNPAFHVRFFENDQWPKNSMIYRQVSKSGDAPWIIAVQRQLVGGAVVTKEVLRSQERLGGTPIPMPFTEDQALEVFTKLAEYEELHESELGRAIKMLGYMHPNEEWIREIFFDVAPTYNTIQINEYFIFVKAYAAKHHEACSRAFSQYQVGGLMDGPALQEALRNFDIELLPYVVQEILDEVNQSSFVASRSRSALWIMADADAKLAMPGQVEAPELGPAEKSKEKEEAGAKRSDPLTRIEERLDTIVKKLDEALSLKQVYGPLRPKEEMSPLPLSTWPKMFPSEPSSRTTRANHFSSEASSRSTRVVFDPPRVKRGTASHIRGPGVARGKIVAMTENWSEGEEQELEAPGIYLESGADDPESPREEEGGRRMVHQVRAVDLKLAWQMHAKECHQELSEADATRPVFRLLYRSKADQVWELLDDQNSSTAAWFISQFLKLFVVLSVAVTNFQTTEERLMDKVTANVFEFFFDAVFLLEFLLRLLAAPSKKRYISDPLNWADMLSALGLPCRIAFVSGSGFFNSQVRRTSDWNLGEVGLLFLLPLIRLMKLLRYFESIPLLIDACYKSFEALPLLTYIMALITFCVPSMQHSLWLSLVTMTTVGYGDYYPTSIAGYFIVSVLTIVSVLFLALPVGIIGNEFTSCWQQRTRVLLLTRAQMRIGITTDSAVDLFQMFDDDQSGTIEYDEFLRHIFPEEYVKGHRKECPSSCHGVASWRLCSTWTRCEPLTKDEPQEARPDGERERAWGSPAIESSRSGFVSPIFDVATARPKASKPPAHIVPRWKY